MNYMDVMALAQCINYAVACAVLARYHCCYDSVRTAMSSLMTGGHVSPRFVEETLPR